MKHIKTYEDLFSFLKKKKPVEPPQIEGDILYEPITSVQMIEYGDSHKTIKFTQSEIDYINGLSEYVQYRSGKEYTSDHFLFKL